MSRSLSKADAIAAHLTTLSALDGIHIAVNREEDLLTQVNCAVEKAAGQGAVIIKWLGGKNPDPKSSSLRMGAKYSISLWTLPALRDGAAPAADDLIEAIAAHLHGWYDSDPSVPVRRLEVLAMDLVPDAPGYLVHEITAEIARL